jgi:hypothetical protein
MRATLYPALEKTLLLPPKSGIQSVDDRSLLSLMIWTYAVAAPVPAAFPMPAMINTGRTLAIGLGWEEKSDY